MEYIKLGSSGTDRIAMRTHDTTADAEARVIDRVAEIALAWLLQKQPVTAPIVGATITEHLANAVGALSVPLSGEDVAWLEEPCVPHAVVGPEPVPERFRPSGA